MLTDQAALAKEITFTMQGDDRFLALMGYDTNFDPAVPNVKDSIGWVALREDFLIDEIACNGPPAI